MIEKLTIRNFKKIEKDEFVFDNFDLLVGANNSGKSTVLQALAIWQFCIEQFRISSKKGVRGIQVVLPSFTALPLPEFNLLWKDRVDRRYTPNPTDPNKKDQSYITVDIKAYWKFNGMDRSFGISLRYQSPQSVYAIPQNGWVEFNALESEKCFPGVVYVPPFSGIEPHEQWMDDGNIRQHIGKSQPGSIIRNLLYRVVDVQDENGIDIPVNKNEKWKELTKLVSDWFGMKLLPPHYQKKISTEIKVEYEFQGKKYDIISAGSGFHQILILLAFYYGYEEVNTLLFDEPDAHLHANLQANVLRFFMGKGDKQFITATHSPEFINNTGAHNIISMLSGKPRVVQTTGNVIAALSKVDNIEVVRTQSSPYILYIEGDDDLRILSAWANTLGKQDVLNQYYPYFLHGTTKISMRDRAQEHFMALRQINPNVKRVQLMDYDAEDTFHPKAENPCIREWKRKNIDNYLLVPDAWKRATAKKLNQEENTLFLTPYIELIDSFFASQNLTLPKGSTWRDVRANIFSVLDGKKLLFENSDALFRQLRDMDSELIVNREAVASAMVLGEIHQDIVDFFDFLEQSL